MINKVIKHYRKNNFEIVLDLSRVDVIIMTEYDIKLYCGISEVTIEKHKLDIAELVRDWKITKTELVDYTDAGDLIEMIIDA